MKRIFATALLFSSFFTPVYAAEVTFESAVNEVTVYPRGAQVTRTASGKVPAGDNVIIINDLPGQLVKNSVRVEGSSGQSIEIGSVDVRQMYVSPNDKQAATLEIERQIEGLNDQIAALDETVANANTQRKLLSGMASNAILPRPLPQGGSVAVSASDLNELMSLTATRFAELSAVTEKARIEKRELHRQITDLENKLAETSPEQKLTTTVAINLTTAVAADANFKIRYNVSNASWAPIYDAKLTLGAKGINNVVKLIRRANVRQATTEKWQNVKLTLSTARPSAATQAPILRPYVLSEVKNVPYAARVRKQKKGLGFSAQESVAADRRRNLLLPTPVKRRAVAVAFSGFLAEYKIPGKVSISNAGAEKNVVIGENEFAAEISANTTPGLDQTAYLTAKFKLKGNVPNLPGTVLLSRDGVFLGRGRLPLLNPNDEHKLSFGRDDFVKVKRSKVTQKAGESGFVSRSKVETRKFVTTVSNLHDFPIKIVVTDRLPYGAHEDIEVSMTPESTKPTITDVDKKRGILAWEKVLVANDKYTINFGYTVSWPKEMRITPVR